MITNKIQSVTGILQTSEGFLLLKRKEIDHTYTGYCLAGGKVDEGESLEDALIREVHEEVGLRVICHRHYQTHENDRFIIHFFFIEVADETIHLNLDEFDDYGFFQLDQLPETLLPITKMVLESLLH